MAANESVSLRGRLTSDPIRNFRFLVTFTDLNGGSAPNAFQDFKKQIGFTSVSGLNISTESIPYREGQFNTTVQQIPGQSTFSPITFQRGVLLGSRQNWRWMEMLFQARDPKGSALSIDTSFRCNIDIKVLNHPVPYNNGGYSELTQERGTARNDFRVMQFHVYNAWPTSVAYSDLNAGDNALIVEQLTVVHEGFDVDWYDENLNKIED